MNLAEARRAAGLTQEQVAAALEVPQAVISYMEKGHCIPTAKQLETLSELYNKADSALISPLERFAAEDAKIDLRVKYAVIYDAVPYGWENRISRAKLVEKMGCDDRTMRKKLEAAKEDGVIICNEGDGYYRPASAMEAVYTRQACLGRLVAAARTYRHINRFVEENR